MDADRKCFYNTVVDEKSDLFYVLTSRCGGNSKPVGRAGKSAVFTRDCVNIQEISADSGFLNFQRLSGSVGDSNSYMS